MLQKLIFYQNKSTIGAAFILAVASLVSRLFGLLRDRLLASTFGASFELDMYYAAFRLPDLVYNILIVGALSVSFIPLFAEHFAKSREGAWKYTINIFNILFLALVALSIILIVFARPLVSVIAPGFSGAELETTVALSRIMFLSPLLLGLSAVAGGVLHYFKRFLVYSIAPVVYNIGIIIGITVFFPFVGLYGLAWGVVLGALLHFIVQMIFARGCGFSWTSFFDFGDRSLRKTFSMMAPRTISTASSQINFWFITAIASLLATGSIAVFNFAHNLSYIPIGIFGITFAMAVFPDLAKSEAEKNREQFLREVSYGFRVIFFLTFPLGFVFYILRAHIVRIILGVGAFGWVDTRLTAAVLGILSLSVFAQSMIPFLARSFFALKDTKTPTILTLIFVALNIVFTFSFLDFFESNGTAITQFLRISDLADVRILALPLAFSVTHVIQFALLLWWLSRRVRLPKSEMLRSAARVVIATLATIPVTYISLYGAANFLSTDTFFGISMQALIAFVMGASIYLFVMVALRSPELISIYNAFHSRLSFKPTVITQLENGKL